MNAPNEFPPGLAKLLKFSRAARLPQPDANAPKSDGVVIVERLYPQFVGIPEEAWRAIDHPPLSDRRYEVSSLGRARYLSPDGKPVHVQPRLNASLYPAIQMCGRLRKGGYFRSIKMVHVLVAKAFVPGQMATLKVHHMDDNTLDARAERLIWVTQRQNLLLRRRRGRVTWGVWTPDEVRKMRGMKSLGFTAAEICRVFPITPAYLCKILQRVRCTGKRHA